MQEFIEERLPPHNVEAEAAVLGSVLIDPDALFEVESFLRPDAFYQTANRWAYEAILALRAAGRPLDVLTLADELRRDGRLEEMGGEAALIDLLNAVPTSVNVEAYGRVVHEAALRRRLMAAAGQIAKMAWDEATPIDGVVGAAERALFAATADMTAGGVKSARDVFGDLLDVTLERRLAGGLPVGLPTGLIDLDRILGGFKKADLIIIAGRPSMGKSALMTSIAAHQAGKLGKRVMLFTLEMSAEQQGLRVMGIEAGLTYDAMGRGALNDEEWARFGQGAGRWAEASLWVDDTPGITLSQLAAKARRIYAEHGLDAIYVDYIGLMGDDEKAWSENDRVGRLSRGLKRLAKELNVPVIALAQLNRGVESRADKRPVLSDLRDSGSLEQDPDVVIFLYRDEYYKPDTTEFPAQAEAIVAKHRNGPTGVASLFFHAKLAAYRNLHAQEVRL